MEVPTGIVHIPNIAVPVALGIRTARLSDLPKPNGISNASIPVLPPAQPMAVAVAT